MEKRNGYPLLVDKKHTFDVLDSGFLLNLATVRAAQACHRWDLCLESDEPTVDYKPHVDHVE